jgi:CRP-like cAMP-binding protein
MPLPSRVYSQGRVIYEQGEPATHLYWLCEGEVELVRYSPSGRVRILRLLRFGELFGIEALVGVRAYRQDAYARRASRLAVLDSQRILELLQDPEVLPRMVRAMAYAVVTVEERLDALLSPEIRKRVAQTLWQWVQPYTEGSEFNGRGGAEAGG